MEDSLSADRVETDDLFFARLVMILAGIVHLDVGTRRFGSHRHGGDRRPVAGPGAGDRRGEPVSHVRQPLTCPAFSGSGIPVGVSRL